MIRRRIHIAMLLISVSLGLATPAHAEGDLTLTAVGELKAAAAAVQNKALHRTESAMQQVAMTPASVHADGTAPAPASPSMTPLPEPKMDTSVPYTYQARAVRDPFMPPIEIRSTPEVTDTANLPELQRYPVGDFTLIGIVWTKARKVAMVSTPDGKGHSLRVGTRVGLNHGKVRRITRDSVIIEEIHTDVFGEQKKFETVLALRPEEVIP